MTAFLLLVTRIGAADQLIQDIWNYLKEMSIVKNETFEPLVASIAFAVWVAMFRLIDRSQQWRKFKIIDEEMRESNYLPPPHAVKSLLAYLVPLFLFDMLFPRRKLPHEAPSTILLLSQVFLGIFVYDFLFFWIHLSMHKLKYLGFLGHAVHHRKHPLEATQVVNHSFADGFLQVMTNIITLHLVRSHPMSRAIHNVVITYMLTELHSGFDIPWMLHRLVPLGILGGPPAHEKHHGSGRQHFQQFFTYLDRAFGYV